MDLRGSLVDTKLRIYPSNKLNTFLKSEKLGDNIPVNIRKLIQGELYESENDNANLKPSNIYLNKNDVDNIRRIKNKLYPNGVCSSDDEDNEKKHVSGKNDEPASDKFLENGDCFNASKTVESEGPEKERKSDKQALETSVDKEECFNISKTGENEDHKKGGKSDKQASDKNIESEDHLNGKLGFLNTFDIDWLYNYVREKKNKGKEVPYLHELLEGSKIQLPENEIIKRNPILEARCVKLRAQQEAREYRKMTKGVDNVRMRFPEDSISYQLKQMNRQLIAIGQFIISIFAGFLFGFRGVEWMVGNLDFGFRLLLGVMCALIIALAEIYFLAKKLNEELNVPETTQLGGPPTFADERFNGNKIGKHNKPHQD